MTDAYAEVVLAAQRAYPPVPGLELIERDGISRIVTPAITSGPLNEVLHTELGGRTDADIDAAIDAVIADYRTRGLQFRWTVGPCCTPADLGARLEARGLAGNAALGMARATATPIEPADPRIEIRRCDAGLVDTFADVMALAWEMDAPPLRALQRAAFADPRQAMFIAFCDGTAAATAALVELERSAYLIGGAVLPAYRGRGLYRALVASRVEHARVRGRALVTCRARASTSAPILARLGFDTVCTLAMYRG